MTTSNWKDCEMLCLIDIWGDDLVQLQLKDAKGVNKYMKVFQRNYVSMVSKGQQNMSREGKETQIRV